MSAKVAPFPRNPEKLPAEQLTDSELADQFGEYDRRYQGCADRRKQLMDEAKRRCENLPANSSAVFEGRIWDVAVGARKFETKLPSMAAIHRMFKAAKKDFYAAVTITQAALMDALGSEVFDRLKEREQTGWRPVSVVLKAQPKAS